MHHRPSSHQKVKYIPSPQRQLEIFSINTNIHTVQLIGNGGIGVLVNSFTVCR